MGLGYSMGFHLLIFGKRYLGILAMDDDRRMTTDGRRTTNDEGCLSVGCVFSRAMVINKLHERV